MKVSLWEKWSTLRSSNTYSLSLYLPMGEKKVSIQEGIRKRLFLRMISQLSSLLWFYLIALILCILGFFAGKMLLGGEKVLQGFYVDLAFGDDDFLGLIFLIFMFMCGAYMYYLVTYNLESLDLNYNKTGINEKYDIILLVRIVFVTFCEILALILFLTTLSNIMLHALSAPFALFIFMLFLLLFWNNSALAFSFWILYECTSFNIVQFAFSNCIVLATVLFLFLSYSILTTYVTVRVSSEIKFLFMKVHNP